MENNTNIDTIRKALIDLYLYIRARSNGNIIEYDEQLEAEKKVFVNIDILIIIDCIKSFLDTIFTSNDLEISKNDKSFFNMDKEQIQKMEAEIKMHLKVSLKYK